MDNKLGFTGFKGPINQEEIVEQILTTVHLVIQPIADCPFCGGEGQLVCGSQDLYYIACEDCEATSPSYETQGQACAWWNRRSIT